MKKCSTCGVNKEFSEFHKDKNRKSGLTPRCKTCFKLKNTENKDKISKYQAKYRRLKLNTNIIFKLKHNLRSRLRKAIKGDKRHSSVKYLGCSLEYFKKYLESKFESGMNWENHGSWHIDHIIPLKNFNLTDEKDLQKAIHYTNMQPLWAFDNLSKGSKIKKPS